MGGLSREIGNPAPWALAKVRRRAEKKERRRLEGEARREQLRLQAYRTAASFSTSVERLIVPDRHPDVVARRNQVFLTLHSMGWTISEIARHFRRHWTSVQYAVRRAEETQPKRRTA